MRQRMMPRCIRLADEYHSFSFFAVYILRKCIHCPCLVRSCRHLVLTDTDTRTTQITLLDQPEEKPGRVDLELPLPGDGSRRILLRSHARVGRTQPQPEDRKNAKSKGRDDGTVAGKAPELCPYSSPTQGARSRALMSGRCPLTFKYGKDRSGVPLPRALSMRRG